MGITATAVYDIERSGTVVLRSSARYGGARADALDTLASFSRHCEAQRGIAQSITEVCAQWGGPPYVTYKVAETRFRVIVIWHESPNDTAVDVPFQVSHALDRLERAVTSVAEALLRDDPSAIAKLYEQATYALTPDTPVILPSGSSQSSQPRIKLPLQFASSRTSTASSDLKKKQSSGLFGKFGAVFKPKEKKRTDVAQASIDADSPFKGRDALDDTEGPLALPDSLFAWCASTNAPLFSSSVQDISWLSALVRGEEVPPASIANISKSSLSATSPSNSAQTNLPALRSGSIASTPLNIPNVVSASTPSSAPEPEPPSPPKPEPPQPVVTPISPEPSLQLSDQTSKPQNSVMSVPPPPLPKDTMSLNELPSPSQEQGQEQEQEHHDPASSYVPSGPAGMSTGSTAPVLSSVGTSYAQSLQPQSSPQTEGSSSTQHHNLLHGVPHVQQRPISMNQTATANIPGMLQAQMQYEHQQQYVQQQQQPGSAKIDQVQRTVPEVREQIHETSAEPASHIQGQPSETTAVKPAPDEFDLNQLGDYKDAATEITNLTSGSGPLGPDDENKAADDAIRKRMNEFALTMQSGNFTLALQQVYGTLRVLCQLRPLRDREINTCASYVLAQRILIRNATLENELTRILPALPDAARRRVECALLTMFLAELKHFLPRHRVAAMRVAVEKNMLVGNFGMSARWLRQLIEKAPPSKKDALVRQLQLCISNGESNAHMPPTNRLCYSTLQIVTSPYGKCDVCPAVYHPTMSGVLDGQTCDTCFVGKIHATT